MVERIREADWKVFKRLRESALQRLCQDILGDCREILDQPDKTAHQRYLDLFKLLHERDKEVALSFDHFSRSRALGDLRILRTQGLITEEEARELSDETRERTRPIDW